MPRRLKGEKFDSIHRAIDMLCLNFGKLNTGYALHLQSPWRFREGNKVLLSSRDIYLPFCRDVPEEWSYDEVGRCDELSSVFDVEGKKLSAKMKDSYVTDSKLSATYDIEIRFSNGVVFEQFNTASDESEEWRLIDDKEDLHIVCYGANIGTSTEYGNAKTYPFENIKEITKEGILYEDEEGKILEIIFEECRKNRLREVNAACENKIALGDFFCVGERNWCADVPYYIFDSEPKVKFALSPEGRGFFKKKNKYSHNKFYSLEKRLSDVSVSTLDLS